MKKKWISLLLAIALLWSQSAYASVGTQEDGAQEDAATDINWSTNLDSTVSGGVDTVAVSSAPTFTGNVTFNTNLVAEGRYSASTNVYSSSTNLAPSSLPWGVINKSVGGGGGLDSNGFGTVFPNGVPGQAISLIITALQPGGSWKVTPTTCTGFQSFAMDTKGDIVSMAFLNTTLGWIITGNGGAVLTQASPQT